MPEADGGETDAGKDLDAGKRRFLVRATSLIGLAGIVAAATPFALSMRPSARAKALGGPLETDIGAIAAGRSLTVEWRGKPIWIVRRTPEMLAQLAENPPLLVDPDSRVASQQPPYARNAHRSIRPEILVLIGICTHLGCVPARHFERGSDAGLGAGWPGGWFCHCHGSKFDYAGRVFKNVPAPTNLVVPPYSFVSETRLLIGVDPGKSGKGG